jgi:hypothetical protein
MEHESVIRITEPCDSNRVVHPKMLHPKSNLQVNGTDVLRTASRSAVIPVGNMKIGDSIPTSCDLRHVSYPARRMIIAPKGAS